MTNEQIIQLVQSSGLLSPPQIERLKRDNLLSGRSIETILSEDKILDDEKLAGLKSQVLKVPYQKVDLNKVDPKLFQIVPEETARTYQVCPIYKEGNMLVVGMVSPDDLKAQEAMRFIARQAKVDLGVLLMSYQDWQSALRKYSPYRNEMENAVKALNLKTGDSIGAQKIVELEGGSSGSEDAPVIRIVASTLREALQAKASDIHIEPQEHSLRIRFRVDGDLKEASSMPPELAQPIASRIKVLSNLKIDETRVPQDGRFRSRVSGREIDFRVATFPTPLGEKVEIRILDPSAGMKSFEQLGLSGRNLDIVKKGLERPYGMILVTGPTGSGKSTTLYALLQMLNDESSNIVSLEDPVEYFLAGVNQSQVRPEIGYDFASGLRQILRQDPDVIMVGEIRDVETAGLAVNAALTGHVVLSTLHTNNSAGVIPRLIDMKVEPFLLPSALSLMTAQRLVSRLCDSCKESTEASSQIQEIISKSLSNLPPDMVGDFKPPYRIYHGRGCDACRGRGITGRIAVFEIIQMTPEIEKIIIEGPTAQKIMSEGKRQGMLTLRQDGVLKALSGLVPIEEVIKETEDI